MTNPQLIANQPKTFPARDDWMKAVLASDLPDAAVRIAIRIGLHLDPKTGQCNPSYPTLAAESHIGERSTYRLVALLEHTGWLAVQRTRGRLSNQYLLLNPANSMAGFNPANPAKSATPTLPKRPRNPANMVAGEEQEKSLLSGECLKTLSQREGERERASRDDSPPGGDPPADAGPRQERPQSAEVQIKPESPIERSHPVERATERSFAALRALWARGWPVDDSPKAIAVQRAAFAKACTVAEPEEILAGARVHVAAADAPRFLPPLAEWLAGRGWEKPPPTKPKRSHNGARHPRRKADIVEIGLALAREYAAERAAS